MLNAGDIISRLRLDKTMFDKGMKQAYTESKATMDRLGKQTKKTAAGMSKDMQTFGTTSSRNARMFGKDWWKAFGQVAIGFTIAYRAMNVLEDGIRALVNVFVSGRQVIDDFRMSIVETAASLQMLTDEPSTEGLEAYYQFAQGVFEKLEIIAAKHISTGEDLRSAYAKLATMGIVPQTEEQLEQMARMVDLVVIQTKGLDKQRQIRTELQAIISGEQRQGAVVARMLNQRVENYKELIKLVKEENVVTEKTEMLFEGVSKVLDAVGSVSDGVLKTHTAWWTTLQAILNRIQRAGLVGMYEDLLNLMKGIKEALLDQNGLTELGIYLAKGLHDAWLMVWSVVKPFVSILGQILWLGNKLLGITTILKGWAMLLVVITSGWKMLGHLIQGDLDAVDRVNKQMTDTIESLSMTQEEFRKKYMKGIGAESSDLSKFLNDLRSGADKISDEQQKALDRWTKKVTALTDEYRILKGVMETFTVATYDPIDFKSTEWLWKTVAEWEKIPTDKLKSEFMQASIAIERARKELIKWNDAFNLKEQIKGLEAISEINRQIYTELKEGKLKPADIQLRRQELEIEAEYEALALKTNATLAARYVLTKKWNLRTAREIDNLIKKEKLYQYK